MKFSARTSWSGRLTLISIVSPGEMICLDLSVMSGRDEDDSAGAIGSKDSYLVAGTIHFPSSSEIR